jgi:predicted membrane protein
MSIALLFAILAVLGIISFFWGPPQFQGRGPSFVLFVMVLLLGWAVFGALIHK